MLTRPSAVAGKIPSVPGVVAEKQLSYISIKKMIEMVMYELYECLHHYSQFQQGSNQWLICDAKRFFKKKEYPLDIVDVCIVAIANALQINLVIFEKVNGEAIFINHQCTTANTNKTIYLKYSHDPEGKHLGDHYDAIVYIRNTN